MSAKPNITMESTDSSDAMPIGFIATDDGRTLLAVAGKEITILL